MEKDQAEDDRALIARTLRGDTAAADQLAQRLACVHCYVRHHNHKLGSPLGERDVEDAAQNAYAALWRKLGAYDGTAALKSWAFGFSRREVLKALDQRRRHARVEGDLDPEQAAAEPPRRLEQREQEIIEDELQRLGSPIAGILRLKCYQELTFGEIAERLGIPSGSVKTYYYRGKEKLRHRLARLWREGGA